MSAEIEALRRFFAAINANDLQAAIRELDPAIVRVEPEGFPTSGTYRGVEAVREQFARGRGSWAEGSCDPERFLVNGGRVVAYVHVRVRLNDSADWIDARIADGFEFRDGRIAYYRTFAERGDALRWAGVDGA